MLGQRGANGSINIKTRTQAVDWGPRRDLSVVRLLVDGFSAPVDYYSPKYEVPASERDFRERAAVYWKPDVTRSEEHTSELQSLMRISYAVFCLKKKKKTVK